MARLTILTGKGAGENFDFEQDVIIGRSPDVQCVLRDPRASRRHSKISVEENGFYLQDLKSNNGTFLNDQRVTNKTRLKNNDNIKIGATHLLFREEEESLEEGGLFHQYLIEKQIRQSPVGSFYLAKQVALKRNILLWVLSSERLAEQSEGEGHSKVIEKRFLEQTKQIANLFHRNILMLLDFAATGQYIYCAFEHIDLTSSVKRFLHHYHPLTAGDALHLIRQAVKGISYAHKQGVYHLHLSESNILVQPEQNDRLVLTEFGVSRFLSEAAGSHSSTISTDAFSYLAPEQLREQDSVDYAKIDIYALGCLMYQLLAGVPPYQAKSIFDLAQSHAQQPIVSLKERRAGLPEELYHLVEKCLEKSPEQRCSIDFVAQKLKDIENEIILREALQAKEDNFVKQRLGKKTLLRWWFLAPLFSITILVIVFFLSKKFLETP